MTDGISKLGNIFPSFRTLSIMMRCPALFKLLISAHLLCLSPTARDKIIRLRLAIFPKMMMHYMLNQVMKQDCTTKTAVRKIDGTLLF
jgi:hypothetical protein